MGKTSPLTGTGKKAQKAIYKAQKYAAEKSISEYKKMKPHKEAAGKTYKDIAEGKGLPEFKSKTKYEPSKFESKTQYSPSKFESKTKYNPFSYKQDTQYQRQGLGDLVKDYERAGAGAAKIFEPIKQQALANYQQNVAPGIYGQFGREQGAGSSALNQALAASRVNLERSLASDFSGIQSGLANQLLGERENQRRFGAQFGQQGEQFGANLRNAQQQFGAQFGQGQQEFGANLRNQQQQFGAQFGAGQEQFGANLRNQQQQFGAEFGQKGEQFANQSALQNIYARMQGAGGISGHQVPQFNPQVQGSYNQKAPEQGGGVGSLLGPIGQGAGTAATAWALAKFLPAAAAASSIEIKDNIKSYDKGLDEVRKMEVKNYDYTIPVIGRQDDRIGLIAEDMPKEIQLDIEGIKHVDVYGLVGILINAIKNLDEKVKTLEAKHA